MARSPTSVRFFTEEGFIVRGTQDPATALQIFCMSDEMAENSDWDQRGFEVYRPRHEIPEGYPGRIVPHTYTVLGRTCFMTLDLQPDPVAVRAFGDMLHEMMGTDRQRYHHCAPGWYRWNPASQADREFEGVSQWICKVKGPGPGVFPGVIFY